MGRRHDSEGAEKRADKLGLADAQITVVLCGDEKVAKCASAAEMHRSWKHLKKRAKQLRKEQGIRVTTIRTQCLDVCRFGPVAGVFPSGCWYGGCDEDTLDQILQAQLNQAPQPEENLIATPRDMRGPG